MTEYQWDKKLHIRTVGRDASHEDENHYPYEPTPYSVLERLAESGYISKEDVLVDYGCGKGRVGFFLHHSVGCKTIGVEYDAGIYEQALQNRIAYGDEAVTIICADAEALPVKEESCFYFFNPFSARILKAVLARILESYYENPRTLRLFFYYPSDEYLSYLMSAPEWMFLDEIDCSDLFAKGAQRERILVFKIEDMYA